MSTLTRDSFQTTHRVRLNYDLPPMRLWSKAKRLGIWNPHDIDFTQDVADWARLNELEQEVLLHLTSLFQAGEEAVTLDLLPLIAVVAAEGRLEEEIYLTSFLWEEAKHVEGFNRFLTEVAGVDGDLSRFHGPSYRRLFYEELPTALGRLRSDASPEAQAVASVTYNLIVEGVLAETGYHAYYSVLRRNNLMPGMQQMVDYLKRDESRHLAYGVFLLSRLAHEHGEPIWQAIQRRMSELLEVATGTVLELFTPYETMPFGLEQDEFLNFAMTQFQHRMTRIEKAKGQTLAELYAADEELEGADYSAPGGQ